MCITTCNKLVIYKVQCIDVSCEIDGGINNSVQCVIKPGD